MAHALLAVEDVTVTFGGRRALDGVSLDAEAGRITGLIGPNGAGKTTLFNVVCGLQPPQRGRVRFGDDDVTRLGPTRRARRGIARTFQRLELFTMLTVRDNVAVAAETHRSWSRRSGSVAGEVEELLDRVGLRDAADQRVTSLPTGRARLVELARALACRPRALLLDEPASGQSDEETAAFARLLGELASDGLAVLLVEHDMRLVMDVCHRVHVLDLGRLLASGDPATVRADAAVRSAYLGSPQSAPSRRPDGQPTAEELEAQYSVVKERSVHLPHSQLAGCDIFGGGGPLLQVQGLRAGYEGIEALHGVDLTLDAGTVHAVLGANGAGKTTLLNVVAGLHPATGGSVTLAGHPLDGLAADGLARAGVCLVPEGRGIFPNLTVRENLWMMTYGGRTPAEVEALAFERFPALASRPRQVAGTLSGGEQQMLAMARALTTDPALLLLDELSMGLAPLVVEELYEIVAQIAAEGVSILVVEQFAAAVLDVADQLTVMAHGSVVQQGRPDHIAGTLTEAYLGG